MTRKKRQPIKYGMLLRSYALCLRNWRYSRGWTQQKIATDTGLSVTYIAMLERGEREPALWVASRIARAFGTTITNMVGD